MSTDPEGDKTPIVPPPWSGALFDHEDDLTTELVSDVADQCGESVATDEFATRGDMWRTRVASMADDPAGMALRHIRHAWRGTWHAGIRHAFATAWRHTSAPDTHPDGWMLDDYRTGSRSHYPNAEKMLADRNRMVAELAEARKKQVTAHLAIVLGCLALIPLSWIFLGRAIDAWGQGGVIVRGFLVLVVGSAGVARRGRRHVCSVANGCGDSRGESVANSAATGIATPDATVLSLTKERIVAALRAHNLISDSEDVELSAGRAETNGCSVVVKLPPSRIAATILTAREKLAGGLDSDIPLVAVEPIKGSARSFRLREYASDPMDSAANPSPPSPLVHVERTWVHKPIRLGRTLDGRTVSMRCVDGAHLLIAGGTGSGKSNACRVRGLAFALDPDATQTIIDAKGSPALRLFRPVAHVFSGTDPAVQRGAALHMRELATTELNRRMEVLAHYAEENPGLVADDGIDDAMARNHNLNVPYMQVWLDECHTVYSYSAPLDPFDPNGETCGAVIAAAVKILITQGRSLGITVDQSTQRPSATNIDTDIRAIATGKLCGHVEEDADAKMVFGARFKERGLDPVNGIQAHVHVGWMFLTGAAKAEPEELSTVLVHCDLADVTATKMAIDRAHRTCSELRPGILPGSGQDPLAPSGTPGQEPDTSSALDPGGRYVDHDPGHLAEIQAVFEEDEKELHSVTIVGRLRERRPGLYDHLTVAGMNTFLRRIDPSLRTVNVWEVVEGERKQAKGLRFGAIEDAYDRLVPARTEDPVVRAPSASETPSDQGADARTTITGNAQPPGIRPLGRIKDTVDGSVRGPASGGEA